MEKVGRFLDRFITYLGYIGAAMGCVSILIMVVMISLSVALRYLFSKPFLFVDEFSGYLLVVVVYMGFAYSVDAHITVDLVAKRLPKKVRAALEVVTLLASLFLIGVFFRFAWAYFLDTMRSHWRAATVYETPLWIPQVFLWVGLIFFGLAIATRVVRKLIDFQKAFAQDAQDDMPGKLTK